MSRPHRRVVISHLCGAEYLIHEPTPYSEIVELAEALRVAAERTSALRAVAFAGALLGEVALLTANLDPARRELTAAADLHRKIGASAGEAHSLQHLVAIHVAQGDRAAAKGLLRRDLPLARWSPSPCTCCSASTAP